jgi:putative hydrolase of the HAD superfamily
MKAVLFDMGDTLVTEVQINGPYIWQSRLRVAEGIDDLLAYLKPRFRLGIVSNTTFSRETDLIKGLTMVGLNGYFDAVVTSVDVGVEKPDPEIFLEATRRLSVKPEECVMVGNRLDADILGANKLGMKTILFQWANDDRSVPLTSDENPTWIAHSAQEIRGIIDKLLVGRSDS